MIIRLNNKVKQEIENKEASVTSDHISSVTSKLKLCVPTKRELYNVCGIHLIDGFMDKETLYDNNCWIPLG